MPIIALGHCRDKERRLPSQRRQETKRVRGTLREERIESLEGDGHLQRGGDADGARVRVTVYTGSQARGFSNTRPAQDQEQAKVLHKGPPPSSLQQVSYSVTRSFWLRYIRKKGSRSVASDSLRPRGLLRPWDSPGKNTGVGCQFLLQGIFPTQGSNPGLWHCGQRL